MMESMGAGFPSKCTGTSPTTSSSIPISKVDASALSVARSISTNTGLRPASRIGNTEVDHETAGTRTFPLRRRLFRRADSGARRALKAGKFADEPELVETAPAQPQYRANADSKAFTLGPYVTWPLVTLSMASRISSTPQDGSERGTR